MKLKSSFLALSGTILVIVIGLLLPKLFFAYQDRAQTKVLRYEMEPFQVRSTSQLSESLLLVSTPHNDIELDSSQAQHSESEICKLAQEALSLLFEYCDDLPPIGDPIHFSEVFPLLIVSTDVTSQAMSGSLASGTSAIIWNCYLYDDLENALAIQVDDRTGKIVSFSYYNNQAATGQDTLQIKDSSTLSSPSTKTFSLFLEKYYQPDFLEMIEEKPEYFSVKLRFSEGDSVTLSLQIFEEQILFNVS